MYHGRGDRAAAAASVLSSVEATVANEHANPADASEEEEEEQAKTEAPEEEDLGPDTHSEVVPDQPRYVYRYSMCQTILHIYPASPALTCLLRSSRAPSLR